MKSVFITQTVWMLLLHIILIEAIQQIDDPDSLLCSPPFKCSDLYIFNGTVAYGEPMKFFELDISEYTAFIYMQGTSESQDDSNCFFRKLQYLQLSISYHIK